MRKGSIFSVELSPKHFIMLDVPRMQLSSAIPLQAGDGFYGASHSSALFGTLNLPWDGKKDLPQGLLTSRDQVMLCRQMPSQPNARKQSEHPKVGILHPYHRTGDVASW